MSTSSPSTLTRPSPAEPRRRVDQVIRGTGDVLRVHFVGPTFSTLARLRAIVRDSIDDVDVFALELCSTELVANAIEHGDGGEIEYEIRRAAEHLTITVRNRIAPEALADMAHNVIRPSIAETRGTEIDVRGRGLGIVEHLCTKLEVGAASDGLIEVRARLPLAFGSP